MPDISDLRASNPNGNLQFPDNTLDVSQLENLKRELNDLLQKSISDKNYAQNPPYLLFQMGELKALMKVDFTQAPLLIWYGDIMGRPASQGLKKEVAHFLLENNAVQFNAQAIDDNALTDFIRSDHFTQHFQDIFQLAREKILQSFSTVTPDFPIFQAVIDQVVNENRKLLLERAEKMPDFLPAEMAISNSIFSLFHKTPNAKKRGVEHTQTVEKENIPHKNPK